MASNDNERPQVKWLAYVKEATIDNDWCKDETGKEGASHGKQE